MLTDASRPAYTAVLSRITIARLALGLWAAACQPAELKLELVSAKRIWAEAPHSAFGDLIRFRGQWFCVFREGKRHVARPPEEDDGKLRVIASKDGETWKSAALIAEPGIDLRDPHLSVTPDGRLMIVAGGSEYPGGVFKTRRPRVIFSRDGFNWSAPRPVLEAGHWLWRVTWHRKTAYGVTYYDRNQYLVASPDGLHWETICEFGIPGGNETTLRFLSDGRAVALLRRDGEENLAMIGWSRPPYKEWQWSKTGYYVGGPNFLVLPGGRMVAGGRLFAGGDRKSPKTALGPMTLTTYEPQLVLPSGGDTSYPGLVWRRGMLWTMYYSSHEGKTAIYLAKVKVKR